MDIGVCLCVYMCVCFVAVVGVSKLWLQCLVHFTQKAQNSPVVSRMTDTSKYTGTHKQRFDAEGKGKGLEGK